MTVRETVAFEKITDAGQVHAFTAAVPSVALHIPWDKVDDYGKLATGEANGGITLGTINSNVFEFIVALLLREGKLGAFDFNSRFYADDDLMVGAADPFQLSWILDEVKAGGGFDAEAGVTFMLDRCHNYVGGAEPSTELAAWHA